MISIERKFLFIHIPKTGGNSLQYILKNYSEDKIVTLAEYQDGIERFTIRNDQYAITKHSTLNHYKQVMPPDTFNPLFKFSTIRNPWDMCISFYFSAHRGKVAWNRDDFKETIQNIATTRDYITTDPTNEKTKRKLKSGAGSDTKPLDGDIDFLIRFERLNEDFKQVCKAIDIPVVELPHKNKSPKAHYTTYYDDELIELVGEKFAEEIDYAHYVYGS